jgi:hypothetical protein
MMNYKSQQYPAGRQFFGVEWRKSKGGLAQALGLAVVMSIAVLFPSGADLK